MKRSLYLCNTVYQIIVALWIKMNYDLDSKSDIIISDHINGAFELCKLVHKQSVFNHCYYVKSKEFCYSEKKNKDYSDKKTRRYVHLFPKKYLKNVATLYNALGKMEKMPLSYDKIYFSNMDNFAQLVFTNIKRKKKSCHLYVFEDGFSSYTKLWEKFYLDTKPEKMDWCHRIIYKYVFRVTSIYKNVSGFYLFNPELLEWKPDFCILELKKIDSKDESFKHMLNSIFNYNPDENEFSRKYIFFEESYFADNIPVNDIEIVGQIAKHVGEENLMIKIHPRNPINRYERLGYLTNKNITIPWEVIILNMNDVSKKVFISICSGTILNPVLIFGMKINAYSIYNLLSSKSRDNYLLNGSLWEFAKKVFLLHKECYTICDSITDIN